MAERVESVEDRMNGVETYRLDDGRRVCFDSRYVADVGLAAALREAGVEVSNARLPVFQRGRQIGTFPAVFDVARIKRTSIFYEARPGDFIRKGDRWEACASLGPGDLEAVPGFVWHRAVS